VGVAAAATLAAGVATTVDGTPALDPVAAPHAASRRTVAPRASQVALL